VHAVFINCKKAYDCAGGGGGFSIIFILSLVMKIYLNKAYSKTEIGDICLIQFLFRMVCPVTNAFQIRFKKYSYY
jgi:hypothetical protein